MRMRRLRQGFVIATLLALSGSALAQREMIGRNEDMRLLVDRSSIVRNGDIATMMHMVDYTSSQWIGSTVIMSVRNVADYDCVKRKTRAVAGVAYSEQLGRGIEVMREQAPVDSPWIEVPVSGAGERLWQVACGRD